MPPIPVAQKFGDVVLTGSRATNELDSLHHWGQRAGTALLIRSTCENDGLSAHERTTPRSVVALGRADAYAWPGAVLLASLGTTGGMGRGTGSVFACFEELSRDSV